MSAAIVTIDVRHTSALSADELSAVRRLLMTSFPGGFTDQDYEHALGGLHALAWADDELVGHGSVVQRRLWHQDRALRAGYVEAVAVHGSRRREGVASAVMDALEAVIHNAYELGALSASRDGACLYPSRGWWCWPGTTSVLAPSGLRRTADEDGHVYVLPGPAHLVPAADLACDWRDGDVW